MNKKSIFKYCIFLFFVCVFLIFGFMYSCSDNETADKATETMEEALLSATHDAGIKEASSVSAAEVSDTGTTAVCYVYVCGQVVFPGVYEVTADSRIYEVIELAGGATADGCLESLNLADRIWDGQKLYVPSKDEYNQTMTDGYWQNIQETAGSGLVNINTADRDELMTLPGIGSTRAEAIIEYRNIHGAFGSIEDIMNVSGIKEGAYNKIKDLICVQ